MFNEDLIGAIWILSMKWGVCLNLHWLTPEPLVFIRKVSSNACHFCLLLTAFCPMSLWQIRSDHDNLAIKSQVKRTEDLMWLNYIYENHWHVVLLCREWLIQPAMGSGANGLHRWREAAWQPYLSAVLLCCFCFDLKLNTDCATTLLQVQDDTTLL